MSLIKRGVNLAYSLKLNELGKKTSDYKEKVVRLKIVQENKKLIPGVIKPGNMNLDMETMSQSQFSDLSQSQASDTSGISETSKLSMARARRGKSNKKKNKGGNVRSVKEGSPFEEELLVDFLNNLVVTKEERKEIGNLIKVLVYFSLIDESVKIHEATETLMKISGKC